MKSVLAMLAAAVLWSTGGLFIKIIALDAMSLSTWRSLVAAVTMLVLAELRGQRMRVPRTKMAWLAASLYAATLLSFVFATKMTTAANAIFLQYTAPIYVLILEPFLMKTRFRPRDIVYVGIALGGMALFFVGKLEAGGMAGNVMALASGVFFAGLMITMRLQHGDVAARWQAVTFGNLVLAAGVGLYLLVTPATLGMPANWSEVGGVLFLGIVQIGIAYALFAYAIAKLGALESTLIGMIEPVLNPVWVFLGTGEQPAAWAFLGAALIVGAVVARSVIEKPPEPEPSLHP
jgi:drug/metabolite transporter (DMT)-like permease